VNFRKKWSAEDVINDWSTDKLLGLVEKTWMGVNASQAAQARIKVCPSMPSLSFHYIPLRVWRAWGAGSSKAYNFPLFP
jgi:hypothetical protein